MLEKYREHDNKLKNFDVSKEQLVNEELLVYCKSYPYNKQYNGRGWVKPLSYVIAAAVAIFGFISAFSNMDPKLMPVICISAFAVLTAVIIKERQFGMMKRLTQYFQDENGEFYRVIFTQGASIMAAHSSHRHGSRSSSHSNVERKAKIVDQNVGEAQEKYAAFYYVQRFKAGIKDWDPMYGGLAKVAHLEKLTLIKRGAKKNVYSCEINGKKTTLKILNNYEGLAEAVEK